MNQTGFMQPQQMQTGTQNQFQGQPQPQTATFAGANQGMPGSALNPMQQQM